MKLITKLYNKNAYLSEWIYTFACFWLPIIAATFILFFALDQMFVNY